MKKIALIIFLFTISNLFSQIDKERIIDWSGAGLTSDFNNIRKIESVNISDFSANGSFDRAFEKIIETRNPDALLIVNFPEGEYKLNAPLKLKSNIIIRGAGSDKTKLIFNLSGKKGNCIIFRGKSGKIFNVDKPLVKGSKIISADNFNYSGGGIIQILQGKDIYGESSSGKRKEYRKGQILFAEKADGGKIFLKDEIRLNYDLINDWGKPLQVREIKPIENSGVENLTVTRADKPPKNGGAVVSFNLAFNCRLKGIESFMGANNHVTISNSFHIEISGSYFNGAYNTGGGGNGYGVSLGGLSTDCLIQNNIFEALRHAMIISGGANGNVFGYNASFNKPIFNIDEASISVHGHYPYLNLFESNYAEYINVDYVWGRNGPYNTFLRNWAYDKGVFGLFRSEELQVERGTDRTNLIANIANVYARGKDNYSIKNFNKSEISGSEFCGIVSLYCKNRPEFLTNEYSFPALGLKESRDSKNTNFRIPAMDRHNAIKKTVDAPPHKIKKRIRIKNKDIKFNRK